jgi:predicted DNA-binding transcriptional regulator YafY
MSDTFERVLEQENSHLRSMLRRYFGSERQIVLDYVNHKGERRDRRIVPYAVFFDISSYHPKEWVLNAWDLDKSEMRSFALSGIRGVHDARPQEVTFGRSVLRVRYDEITGEALYFAEQEPVPLLSAGRCPSASLRCRFDPQAISCRDLRAVMWECVTFTGETPRCIEGS